MIGIKSYKDGNRLIIAIDGCSGEIAKKVNRFLGELIGLEAGEEMPSVSVPDVEPVEVDTEPPSVTDMQEINSAEDLFPEPVPEELASQYVYDDRTLETLIDEKDTGAIVNLLQELLGDKENNAPVIAVCKSYLKQDCARRVPENATTKEIKRFFVAYYPLLKKAVDQILEQSGFAMMRDFFDVAADWQHQDAYKSALEALNAAL